MECAGFESEDGMTNQSRMTIGIRADGNETIGMGHLMRCMSIAAALKMQGAECIFFTADREAGKFVEEKGFVCRVLESDYRCMEQELFRLEELLEEYKVSLLLTDSYQVTQVYLDALMVHCPVYYMDDMGVCGLRATGLINYNIYAGDLDYENWDPGQMQLLLGAAYAPVKAQFTEVPYRVRSEVKTLLITMGGSDALNIAGQLGELLLQALPERIRLQIICGRFNPHLDQLKKLEQLSNRVHICVDVQDMWNKMKEADIAISAAGSTLYELCAMGVPTVCCYYVENQKRIAEGFADRVGMANGGDFSKNPKQVLQAMVGEACKLEASLQDREELSQRMKRVTDGKGAQLIAKALLAQSIFNHDG